MSRFANSYWSADYITGINNLKEQSQLSLKQLHELRLLVFNYMSYYHANSQYLNKFSIDSSTSSFNYWEKGSPLGVSSKDSPVRSKLFNKRTISLAQRKLNELKQMDSASMVKPPAEDTNNSDEESTDKPKQNLPKPPTGPKITMDVPLAMYIKDLTAEANTLMSLASTIDREVLESINDFIKSHEPYIRTTIDRLDDLLSDYISTYADVEKLKSDYSECRRMKEFSDNEIAAAAASKINEQEGNEGHEPKELESETSSSSINVTPNSSNTPDIDNSDSSVIHTEPSNVEEGGEFEFPLFLGPAKLRSRYELSAFLKDALSKVETTKRTFPLPGHKSEIFSSEELCKFLVHRRPFRINPTRLNLERFGQGLLDLKLIVGNGIMNYRKFRSEGLWFEWSDLAVFISSYQENEGSGSEATPEAEKDNAKTSNKSTPNSTPNGKMRQRLLDEVTTKHVNEMASNTSKRLNDMFRSMKLSILHTDYDEKLEKLEQEYNEKYYDLHELKFLIDNEVLDRSQALERFEKMKIGLIYQSMTKLLEVIYNFSLDSTTRLHKFASTFISHINKPGNFENDFNGLLEHFSTGIYSPSILSPENFQKHQYSTTQANNNFQNLKLQFNLYKDIPLQINISQTDKDNELLSFASLPFFVYQVIKLVEHKQDDTSVKEFWEQPINHNQYWNIKEKIIDTLSNETFDHVTISNETSLQQHMIEKTIEILGNENLPVILNFIKNWLLEIGDSLIPCLIYDSLIQLYKGKGEASEEMAPSKRPDLIKILSSIPRSNISSLLYILEHISVEYSLSQIPSFGLSDEFPEELKTPTDKSVLGDAAKTLNIMDSIGAVPFTHLILRPSPIKSANGLKPPMDIYNLLLEDLLSIDVRSELFMNLVNNERNYQSKKQQEKSNLGLQKVVIPPSPRRPGTSLNLAQHTTATPKSPMPISASENFSLRPFHTKSTPVPSPSSSPRNLSRELFDAKNTPAQKKDTRERSASGSFLQPGIDVEFAKK